MVTSLTDVMSGQRPQIAASESWVIAYSGTDFDLDRATTRLALSRDGGHNFATTPFDEQLYNPGVVIRDSDAIVVGTNCSRPPANQGFSCAPEDEGVVARRLDLDTRAVHELPDPPLSGFVTDSVGWAAGRAWFDMSSTTGRVLLGWSDDEGWLVADLADATQRICPVGDVLVAVTLGAAAADPRSGPGPMEQGDNATGMAGSAIEPTDRGAPLFSASTSDDGSTWSTPTTLTSEHDDDFNFIVGVSCGPTAVVAYTKQVGVYAPDEGAWRHVQVPQGIAVGPGTANAWTSNDELRLWSLPTSEAVPLDDTTATLPQTTYDQLRLRGLHGGPVRSDVVESEQDLGSTPQELRGAGAAAHGFILLADDDFTLVGVR